MSQESLLLLGYDPHLGELLIKLHRAFTLDEALRLLKIGGEMPGEVL